MLNATKNNLKKSSLSGKRWHSSNNDTLTF